MRLGNQNLRVRDAVDVDFDEVDECRVVWLSRCAGTTENICS